MNFQQDHFGDNEDNHLSKSNYQKTKRRLGVFLLFALYVNRQVYKKHIVSFLQEKKQDLIELLKKE